MTDNKLDAGALKAFVHPVRLKLYELLEEHGAATATQLAARVGENTGVTSYHLRKLAAHGLIVDVPEQGKGKERFWKTTGFTADIDELRRNPETAQAAEALATATVRQRGAELARWVEESRTAPRPWVVASLHTHRGMQLTLEQLEELNRQVTELLDAFQERVRDQEDEGAVRVVVNVDAFPVRVDHPS
ncbi:winged helix-turn-helix domain-containing protein [Microtetraspora malaysiensis]|uniref:winged helix-turn-helix domain-containing protein n=1 Tax=Microtetraspora malaysiensis TaxID=161358 RepID=UPI003D919173